jgi:DNA primase
MLTIGPGSGMVSVLGGWRTDPLIVVEGLFDALSLAMCGFACAATIGRWVPWLAEVSMGRTVWLAFDAGRPGEAQFARYAADLGRSDVKRMLPPGRSKDWSTSLVKGGTATVARWVQDCLSKSEVKSR